MRIILLKTKVAKSFKNKKIKNISKVNLKLGNIGFFFSKYFRFEYIYIHVLKKYFKYFFQIKYLNFKKFFFWIFLTLNYPLTKKSKNARMGKGKGNFFRWSVLLNYNFIFLEFNNLYFLKKFIIKKILNFFFPHKIFFLIK